MTPKQERLKKLLDKLSTHEEVEMRAFQVFRKSLKDIQSELSNTDLSQQLEINNLNSLLADQYKILENSIAESAKRISFDISDIDLALRKEIKTVKILVKSTADALSLNKKETSALLKKIEKDIESLFWQRTFNGSNNVQAVLNIKSNGTVVANNISGINFTNGSVVSNPDGSVSYTSGGGSTSFIDNEVVSGNTNTFTLANTPIVGSEHIFALGQRLTPGGVDYTISGAVISTINPWSTGQILADYRK